jgi:hypothetical protein
VYPIGLVGWLLLTKPPAEAGACPPLSRGRRKVREQTQPAGAR